MAQHQRISRTIQEYDAQGWHRTGTEVDHKSARWLADKGRKLGLDVALGRFKLSRIDSEFGYLEVDGQRIEGLPMYDGTFTGLEGIHGRIGVVGSSAEIGLSALLPHLPGKLTGGAGGNEALQAESS